MKKLNICSHLLFAIFSLNSFAHNPPDPSGWNVVDRELIEEAQLSPTYFSRNLQIGLIHLSEVEKEKLSHIAHEMGRCGGFESLGETSLSANMAQDLFSQFESIQTTHNTYKNENHLRRSTVQEKSEDIQNAVDQVQIHRLRKNVEFLSNFHSRCHKSPTKNDHSDAMKARFEQLAQSVGYPVEISQIDHNNTEQKSLRVRLVGKSRPDEVVVLGGHYDSITGWNCRSNRSPGVDDNASGSANLIEILEILLQQKQPERTIEFMWYAAEEVGLVGSSQIARNYKSTEKNVIAVLQLDMTLHPGDGIGSIGLIEDFTSPWLNNILVELNDLYVQGQIMKTRCGYACSDHASWHRQGFHAAIPFESRARNRNRKIHSSSDVIGPLSSFEHSAYFARLGVAFALYLANSDRHGND